MVTASTPVPKARKKSGVTTKSGHGGGGEAAAAIEVTSATVRRTNTERNARARRMTWFTRRS